MVAEITHALGSEELNDRFGVPSARAVGKVQPLVDEWSATYIARSPFCVLATASADGRCDASPKGGEPGFVVVDDPHTLLIPDFKGNNLFFGMRNVLENPHVGLLFMIPGRTDTLRINGRALLVRDGPFFDRMAVEGRRPVLAAVVEVEEVFYHCTKAFHRSGLWRTERWDRDAAPSRGEVARSLEAVFTTRFGAVAFGEEYAQERCAL